MRCTRGAVWDVIVDLRPGSPTRGQWFGSELTADNANMIFAPEGFAHGYQTLCDDTEVTYLTSIPYAPAAARGVRYNDPSFGIAWPLPPRLISRTDESWPDLRPVRLHDEAASKRREHLWSLSTQPWPGASRTASRFAWQWWALA